jgi:Phage integrase family
VQFTITRVAVPLPPAVGRAIDRAIGTRTQGPILLNSRSTRMDRHAATRRLRRLAETAGVRITSPHPHMLRHTFVTTMLDAGVDLRDVQIAARHADPRTTMRYDRARKNLNRHPNYTSSPPTWNPAPEPTGRLHRFLTLGDVRPCRIADIAAMHSYPSVRMLWRRVTTNGLEPSSATRARRTPNFSSLLLMSTDHSFGAAGFAYLTP